MDHDRIDNNHVPYIKKSMDRIKKAPTKTLDPAPILLRKWLIKNNMTVPQFAMRTGFNPGTIYNFISGQPWSYPSLAQAFAMEWVTEGKVPAYLWLDNPYVKESIRSSQLKTANRFENSIKSFVLKYNSLKTTEGMIRHKARMLSRLFGVEWGEVKRRCWEDAKERSKPDRASIEHLMNDPITQEEHDEQNQD